MSEILIEENIIQFNDILKTIQGNDKFPESVVNKLEIIKNRTFDSTSKFKATVKILLDNDFDKYGQKVFEYIDIVEGDDDIEEIDYSNPDADVDIREEPQTVYQLVVRKWNSGVLVIDPEFQRNFVWKPEQQSQFIESILLNFPLPPIYLNQTGNGKLVVVDGRQRLTTLQRFLTGKLKLSGLKALGHLNGLDFNGIVKHDFRYQTKIEDKKLLVYKIMPTVPLEMVYEIFNRINTGGTQLERQEIRNCIYIGRATTLLHKLSEKGYFRKAIDYGISSKRMKDQETILRFIAFQLQDYKNYKGGMNNFVEKAMIMINKVLTEKQIADLEQKFEHAMLLSRDCFGNKNFRFPTRTTRGRINIALFECISYFFANHSEEYIRNNKSFIKKQFKLLLKDNEFINAIRFSTGDKNRVKTRFEKVQEYFKQI